MLNNEFADGFRIGSISNKISNNSGSSYLFTRDHRLLLTKNSTNLRVAKSPIQSCAILQLR